MIKMVPFMLHIFYNKKTKPRALAQHWAGHSPTMANTDGSPDGPDRAERLQTKEGGHSSSAQAGGLCLRQMGSWGYWGRWEWTWDRARNRPGVAVTGFPQQGVGGRGFLSGSGWLRLCLIIANTIIKHALYTRLCA